jgi:hypothetical protein
MSLTAYSGGTVWDLHPLRVAAGANVKLSAASLTVSAITGRFAKGSAEQRDEYTEIGTLLPQA